jgi:3',5'-cyclic-AMP phosphodiesterase
MNRLGADARNDPGDPVTTSPAKPDPAARAGPLRVSVFAVEDTAVQLTWSSLPAPAAAFEIGDQSYEVEATAPSWSRGRWRRGLPPGRGGPGGLVATGLQPDTDYAVTVSVSGRHRRLVATVRTLPPGPGRLLGRFATVSDSHVGERRLGLLGRLHDPAPRPPGLRPYPERTLSAAVTEACSWGAERIIAKGDLTQHSSSSEAETVGEILTAPGVPAHAVLGNHDVRGSVDVAGTLSDKGVNAYRGASGLDLPGVRIVFGHSPVPGLHGGRLGADQVAQLAGLVGEAPGPAVVVLHHPLRRHRLNTSYPPALSHDDSTALAAALAVANRNVVVVAGHTHRNRHYRVGGVDVAEVGSSKDYPGQWAGYSIYEGGIRQVVYRTGARDTIAWTEMTRLALGGVWGWWSPGRLTDRCWTLEWR